MSDESEIQKGLMQRILDVVEKAGNMVPHPVLIFLALILIVIVLSHLMQMADISVTFEAIVPKSDEGQEVAEALDAGDYSIYDTGTTVNYETLDEKSYEIKEQTVSARSLISFDGVRFMYVSLIPNFMSFTAVGLMIAAMVGAGVAEASGLVNALIRKLVLISPRWALIYILSFVGILSSIAADAGYLVLIPLAGTAFLSVGRHPIAGLALGFAAVAGAFTVNMLIKPLDAVLVEFTNDAIALVDPDKTIGLASNLWFSIASVIFLTFVLAFVTERLIEPRMGVYDPKLAGDEPPVVEQGKLSSDESRGLLYAFLAVVATLIVFGFLTIPTGAPLRDPETDILIGNSPFMNGLIALIMILFLAAGIGYGYGAKTITSLTGIIQAMEKAMSGLGGLILLFLVLSQFIAYFNYTNMGTILALKLADILAAANFPALLLLIGFIVVVAIIDLLITGAIAKWALFAPIFVPLLMALAVAPEAVLAAYRVADSPINTITPLNAYFALVVGFAQKYDKSAGVGTVVSMMLPYVVILFVVWTGLFALWQVLGLPWGL